MQVGRVVCVRGRSVRRLIPSRRGTSLDRSELALVVRAVGTYCRSHETGFGTREAARVELALLRVGAIGVVQHRVHYVVGRIAGIEGATNLVGFVNQAWYALNGRDLLFGK